MEKRTFYRAECRFKGTVGAGADGDAYAYDPYPVAGGDAMPLECEAPYVKSGDFVCEGGQFSDARSRRARQRSQLLAR